MMLLDGKEFHSTQIVPSLDLPNKINKILTLQFENAKVKNTSSSTAKNQKNKNTPSPRFRGKNSEGEGEGIRLEIQKTA